MYQKDKGIHECIFIDEGLNNEWIRNKYTDVQIYELIGEGTEK